MNILLKVYFTGSSFYGMKYFTEQTFLLNDFSNESVWDAIADKSHKYIETSFFTEFFLSTLKNSFDW